MKRFLPLLILIVGLLVNGCVPPSTTQSPQKTWQSFKDKDQFTDLESCSVSLNSKARTLAYTTLGYMPYIELKNDTLRLGLHNINGIPVGDIQLRIDENKFHTITTSETPIDLFPQELSSNMENSMNMVNKESLGAGINYETMMNNMMKTLSPYTATTGDKAWTILNEMLKGKKMIYRTIGINQAASTTGEVLLDESLLQSLRECGIVKGE